jgi:hypothetical protein
VVIERALRPRDDLCALHIESNSMLARLAGTSAMPPPVFEGSESRG